jgi:hypothetical protein
VGRGQRLSGGATAEALDYIRNPLCLLRRRYSALAFFNCRASSATLILQVELVQPVELVELVDAPTWTDGAACRSEKGMPSAPQNIVEASRTAAS